MQNIVSPTNVLVDNTRSFEYLVACHVELRSLSSVVSEE